MQEKKKILVVCRGFYPLNSPRSYRASELAKEFARQGHRVTVLTPKNNKAHSTFEKEHNLTIKDLGIPRWENPDFGKSKLGVFLTRATCRFLSLAFEFPSIELMFMVKKKLRKEKGYDLLISVAVPYPIHWGVAWVWNKKQKIAQTWVADCGDPYMGCVTDSFKKWFYFRYLEKWFMRKADFITIPVDTAKAGYYNEFHNKIRIIPQGFKFEPIAGAGNKPQNSVPTFAYAGGFIPKIRDPRPFLEYLSTLSDDFKFIIYSNDVTILEAFYIKLNNRLKIKSYIPRKKLLEVMARMDFLVNFENNTSIQVPSKLIDYALTKRPVLSIKNDFDETIVNQFIKGDYQNKLILPDIDEYDITNVVAKFLELLN